MLTISRSIWALLAFAAVVPSGDAQAALQFPGSRMGAWVGYTDNTAANSALGRHAFLAPCWGPSDWSCCVGSRPRQQQLPCS